jgi:hypothetical protein
VVTSVSCDTVTYAKGKNTVTVPLSQFTELAKQTLAKGATFIPAMSTTTPATGSSGSHQVHAKHHSPSSSGCWYHCTAATAFLEANSHRLPPDKSSKYADEGTQAHDYAADVLRGKLDIEKVPEDFRPHVKLYVDHCNDATPEGVSPQIEVSIPLFYNPGQPGTVDFAALSDERIVIRDLKYGAGELVFSFENTQLAIYAKSLIAQLVDVFDFTDDTVVDIHVFQPRHREALDSQPWITTLGEFNKFCEGIEYRYIQSNNALERVKSKLPCGERDITPEEILEAAPGVSFNLEGCHHGACRWRNARAFCGIYNAAATEALVVPDSGLTKEQMVMQMPDLTKEEKKLPALDRVVARLDKMGVPASAITEAYLVGVFASAGPIKSLLNDVEEYLESRALQGQIPEGTKLVMGRPGNRAWTNESSAETFLKNQGLLEKQRYDWKIISPTKAEEVLGDRLKVKRTEGRFKELVTRSEPKKTLALASDKREACLPDIASLPDMDVMDEIDNFEV